MSYVVQEHLKPRGLARLSSESIDAHWALYEGYVRNTNELVEELDRGRPGSRNWSELKRRLAFELNGMVLHEYYFGNLEAGATLSPQSALAGALVGRWGSIPAWREDFAATAAMRGVGWAILYHDAMGDGLFNWWVSEHEIGHPAGLSPILVLDVFEHAWLIDYRVDQKPEYVEAFLANVRWSVVEQRFKDSLAGGIPARF